MVRVLVIDDEHHARNTLINILGRHCPEFTVVGQAEGVVSGMAAIRELQPELVLLDIQMKDGTGFDLLAALPAIDFRIIFVTAFDKYALQAFKFSAVDYLMKPVNPAQFVEAVGRVRNMIMEHFRMQTQVLEENLKTISNTNKKIIIKTTENIHLLEIRNIICCDSDSCYTTIHTSDGEKIMVSKTLKDYEEMLADCGFYRVHKSNLINLLHIKRFERQDGGYIVLTNNLRIPVSSRRRDHLLELIEKLAE